MYADPNLVRLNRITARFDQYEMKLLEAIANFTGVETAVLVRQMAIQAARELVNVPPTQDIPSVAPNPAALQQR